MTAMKPLGEQMAALNTSENDASFAADRSNSMLNATCPARIQNNTTSSSNASFNADTTTYSGLGKLRRPKREPLKISPLAQIDEVPPPPPKYGYVSSAREKRPDYKTRLCDAFRRNGFCPYNNNCTYAHGERELQIPKRRSPSEIHRDSRESRDNYHRDHHKGDLHRRSSRDRRDYLNRSSNNTSRRHNDDDRSNQQSETSFSRGGGASSSSSSSRYRDDHSRPSYHQNHHHHQSEGPRPICHAFQRGNCRYGPRCRYLHQEQLPQFNANATMFAAPPPMDSTIAYYHHQNTTQTYMMPYFIPIPPPGGPPQQFIDLNQSIPMYLQAPPLAPPTYYCPPQTPTIMDQSSLMVTASVPYGASGEPVYNIPPPALPQILS